MSPKVSIVLPTYNGEKYIEESIKSIINQTFHDWELIIVDDCSTDNTPYIVRQYEKQDNRIRVIQNLENKKLPLSLNIGFADAKGEYLTWTSDDNIYIENAIELMNAELDRSKDIYMVYAGMINIDEYGKEIDRIKLYSEKELPINNIIGACFMYRREVYQKVGGYDANLFLVEDYDYWLRILEKFDGIKPIPEYLYLYRKHSGSLTERRKKTIEEQLEKLKRKHIETLLKKYKADKSVICQLYFDWIEQGYDVNEIQNKVFEFVPELRNEKRIIEHDKVIIFGAGEIGIKAKELLNEKAVAFVDNDKTKWGQYKEGINIISPAEIMSSKNSVDIVLAVSKKYIYEIIVQLATIGIHNFSTFQSLSMEK